MSQKMSQVLLANEAWLICSWLINNLIKKYPCNKHSFDFKYDKDKKWSQYDPMNQSISQQVKRLTGPEKFKKNVPSILDPRVSQVNCEIFSQTLASQGWTIVGHYFAGFWEVTTKNHLYLRLVHVLLSRFYLFYPHKIWIKSG